MPTVLPHHQHHDTNMCTTALITLTLILVYTAVLASLAQSNVLWQPGPMPANHEHSLQHNAGSFLISTTLLTTC